jgi:hypothetical protein
MDNKKRLIVAVTAFFCISGALPFTAIRAQVPDQAAPVMLVDHETKLLWERMSLSAPQFTWERSLQQSFASSLSLLSHLNYVPAERNQGSCGNCWAWAGTGAMEIALDLQQGIHDRLSVQFINSCNAAKGSCAGGWLADFAGFYATQGYAVPWSNTNAQWQSGNGSAVSCDTIEKIPHYGIQAIATQQVATHGIGQAQAIANIKAALNQNKPVWFGFFMATSADWNTFSSFWMNQDETAVWSDFFFGQAWTSGGGGHAVLVVGYNDDDPGNPYWIMLNSWGTAGGRRPNGLLRVSMNLNYDGTDSTGSYNLFWQTLDVTFQTGTTVPAPVLNAEPATTPGTSNTISWTAGGSGSPLSETGVIVPGISSGIADAGALEKIANNPPELSVPLLVFGDLKSTAAGIYARRTADKHVIIQPEATKGQLPKTLPGAWQWIYNETFEGDFPGTNWTLYGNPTWNDTNYAALGGSRSGWCAASSVSPSSGYPNNMDAWMVYGPFSLAGATTAQANFWYKNSSEPGIDSLQWLASTDGSNFYGHKTSGDQPTWSMVTFDLTAVPTLGNLCGRDQVWFALRFVSDGSVSGLPGAFVDEIVIQKDVLPTVPDLIPYLPAGWNDQIPIGTAQLAGEAVHAFSGPFYNNQTLYFNWASLNQGTAASGGYRVHVEVTGTGGGTWNWDIPSNAVNQYWYVLNDQSVGPLSAGSHTFRMWVDDQSAVAEADENNNYYERTINVSTPNLPDLAPYKPASWNEKTPIGTTQLAGTDLHNSTGPFNDSQVLYFNWASINQGAAASGGYRVHVQVTGTGGGTWDWDLASNAINEYWYLVSDQSVGPLDAGTHTFKVWVDYQGAVSEADENNNYYERTITVTASGSTTYYAECANNQNFSSPQNSGWITGTNHTFTGLTPGASYWYRVKARQGNSESAWSNVEHSQQEAQLLNPPNLAAPANSATNQPVGVSLQWSDINSSPQESGYRIRIKPSGGNYTYYSVGQNGTSYPLSALSYNTIYNWNVQAMGNGSSTADSAWANGGTDWSFTTSAQPPQVHVNFGAVPSPTEVIYSGRSEVLGAISLIVNSNGLTGTQTGSWAQIGVLYSNGIQVDNNTNGGIKLFFSIGFNGGIGNAPYISSVQNLSVNGRCSGFIIINVPPGLTVQPNDYIRLEGVRGRIDLSDGAIAGTDLYAQLQSVNDPAANSFSPGTIRVARSLPGLNVEVKDANVLLCYPPTGVVPGGGAPNYAITISEGFVRAFVVADNNIATGRVDSSGALLGAPTNSTKIRVILNSIPASISSVTWPETSSTYTIGGNSSWLAKVTETESFSGGMAECTYVFTTQNQANMSDINLETYTLNPILNVSATNQTSMGMVLGAAALYPFADTPGACDIPLSSNFVQPRFATFYQSSNGATSTSKTSTLFDLYAAISRCNSANNPAGDINGDGKSDILWRHSATGDINVWYMNGTTVTGDGWLPRVADQQWKIVGIGDFDKDGKGDILWRYTPTGDLNLWFWNGVAVTSDVWLPRVANPQWQIAGIGDFNKDGRADIVWRNTVTGDINVWFMNGGTVTSDAWLPRVVNQQWQIAGIGDFNGDGGGDIVWRYIPSGDLNVWLMNGVTVTSDAWLPRVSDPQWQINAIGDFNGDGKAEIVWRHTVFGDLNIWFINDVSFVSDGWLPRVVDQQWKIFGPK